MSNTERKKKFIIPFILTALREVCSFSSSHKKGPKKPLTFRLTYKGFLADQRNTSLAKWNGYQCLCHTHISNKTYQYELLLCWLIRHITNYEAKEKGW